MQSLMCAVGVLNILRTKMFLKIGKSQFFPSFFDAFAKNRSNMVVSVELEIHRYTGNRKIWKILEKISFFPRASGRVFKIPGSGSDLNFGDCRTKFYMGVR
jgi:hypothetical protein